jgi:hypothetical protein
LISCKFWEKTGTDTQKRGRCLLGWFGGFVTHGNCTQCIAKGDNTPEAKAAFDARANRAHPGHRPRLSGCCDRADQA